MIYLLSVSRTKIIGFQEYTTCLEDLKDMALNYTLEHIHSGPIRAEIVSDKFVDIYNEHGQLHKRFFISKCSQFKQPALI